MGKKLGVHLYYLYLCTCKQVQVERKARVQTTPNPS